MSRAWLQLGFVLIVLSYVVWDALIRPPAWAPDAPTPECLVCWTGHAEPWIEKGGTCHWATKSRVACDKIGKYRLVRSGKGWQAVTE